MAGEDEGDAHTLGLLGELRALCQKIADHNDGHAIKVHRLLQQRCNPNLHGLHAELHFRVVQLGPGYYGERLRVVSANASSALGHATARRPARTRALKTPRPFRLKRPGRCRESTVLLSY